MPEVEPEPEPAAELDPEPEATVVLLPVPRLVPRFFHLILGWVLLLLLLVPLPLPPALSEVKTPTPTLVALMVVLPFLPVVMTKDRVGEDVRLTLTVLALEELEVLAEAEVLPPELLWVLFVILLADTLCS